MDKKLRKAQVAISSLITLFDYLSFVIVIGDLYQFTPVSGRILGDLAYSEKEIHKKVL